MPSGAGSVRPLVETPPPRTWLLVLAALIVGGTAIYVSYASVAARLPSQIPSHWDVSGHVNGYSSPIDALAVGEITEGIVGAVFVAMIAWMDDSDVLQDRYGTPLIRPLAAFEAFLLAVALPFPFVELFLGGAGEWTAPTWVGLLLFLVPALALVPIVWGGLRAEAPQAAATPGRPGARRSLRFRCTACGQEFVRSPWVLLAPRVGISGFGTQRGMASYYLRCPLCGERGWQESLGWQPGAPLRS